MSDVLPAEADHRRSPVAVGGYVGHMADVSRTPLAVKKPAANYE